MGAGENKLTMPGKLQNKTILITGTTGIAAATAELAVSEGARVFVTGLTAEAGQDLRKRILTMGGDCEFAPADLTQSNAVDAAVAECLKRFERLDALFNVVGISGRKFGDGPVHECSDEGWLRTMDTNLQSTFYMCRAALKQMLAQAPDAQGLRGAIVNMSSVLGFAPSARHFATHAYATSKAAILGLTRSMAAYYAPLKIRVNALAPALVRTPMSQRAQQDETILHLMKTKQPLAEGLIEPEAIARAAVFLMSDDAAMITGDTLTVDAGWSVSEGKE